MNRSAIVVGTGPAAAGAVQALLSGGWKVTVLDVGNRLEASTARVVDRMSKLPVEQWDNNDLERVTARGHSHTESVHAKRSYGSDFAFDDGNNAVGIEWSGTGCFHYSLAFGGLSNVWGSAMLPYRAQDIADWPIELADLEPHYRSIMELVPCTESRGDDIDEILPGYSTQSNGIRLSSQGQALLADLQSHRAPLQDAGIRTGKSRLAIRAQDPSGQQTCQYCTLCLSGCPYGLIYSSAHSFRRWIDEGKIEYVPGHLVERVEQKDSLAIVHGTRIPDNQRFRFETQKLFLATGVLPTAKIVSNSRADLPARIRLIDSQYFICPLLRFKAAENVANERMHTSSQLFMEVDDSSLSRNLIHMQIYGYSTFLHEEVMRTFLRFPLRWPWLRTWFFNRLMVIQGFLHSNDSGHIELTRSGESAANPRLCAHPVRAWDSVRIVLSLALKLLGHARHLGALVLLPGIRIPRPGSGYHSGGTFPMRAKPEPGETDTLGRLPGWPSIHLVDSSVFPSIAATTIVMTSMANAHRIATLATRSEPAASN